MRGVRRLLWAVFALFCSPLPAVLATPPLSGPPPPIAGLRGGASSRGDPDFTEVTALEERLWTAWRQRDQATIAALSDPSYVNVDENGVAGLADILSDFSAFHLEEYELGPMSPLRVGRDAIILNYNARIRGHLDTRTGPVDVSRPVSESSLWVRRPAGWRNLMLHETTRAPIRFPSAAPPTSSVPSP